MTMSKNIGFAKALLPLVRSGVKTQTRRVMKINPGGLPPPFPVLRLDADHVPVLEGPEYEYRADRIRPRYLPGDVVRVNGTDDWIRFLDVRAERLQAITEEEARKEGVTQEWPKPPIRCICDAMAEGYIGLETCATCRYGAKTAFAALWDSIAKPGFRWDDSPWVWVYTYELTEAPDGNC